MPHVLFTKETTSFEHSITHFFYGELLMKDLLSMHELEHILFSFTKLEQEALHTYVFVGANNPT